MDELEAYASRWPFERSSDEAWTREGWVRAFIHLHASAALLAKLHATEQGFSERAREVIANLASLAGYAQVTDGLHEPDTFYVPMPDYYNGTVSMRRSFALLCVLAWCLRFHAARADGDASSAFAAAVRAFQVAEDASFTIWAQLADNCQSFHFQYDTAMSWLDDHRLREHPFIDTRIGKVRDLDGSTWSPHYPGIEYWTFARGLCISRLSRDEYRDLRMDDERHTAHNRLKRYFFAGLWDAMSPAAQDALITADLIYWAPEGSKDTLLENLRHATEVIFEEQVAGPFREWRTEQGIAQQSSPAAGPASRELRALVYEVWEENGRHFEEFATAYFAKRDIEWGSIQSTLRRLARLRNTGVHPRSGKEPPLKQGEAEDEYKKVVGINRRGLLQRLLALQPPTA